MKGRTICPKCKHEFVLDIPEKNGKHDIVCPKCKNSFAIQAKCPNPDGECSWEEHGEPRKTILSSKKPRSNKPVIAGIVLICVFSIGIATAFFAEAFIETSLDVASQTGLKGRVEIVITDVSNNSIEDVSVTITGVNLFTDENGRCVFEEIELGIQNIEISKSGSDYSPICKEVVVAPVFDCFVEVKMTEGSEKIVQSFDSMGCTIILLIFTVFPLLGALTCLKRQHLDVSVVGSLIGIATFGFFLVGSVLSIIAFALIMVSRDEFENGKKGKIF